MSRRPIRRWIVLSALALVAFGALAPRWLSAARAENHFTIRGHASGLLPGVRGDLVLKLENPFGFAIVVHGVRVLVDNVTKRCTSRNLTSPGLAESVRIHAHETIKVTAPVKLRRKAPEACEGKRFPLTFSAKATRP